MVSSGDVMLDRIVFYHMRFYPFMVKFGCVRANASIFPRIPGAVAMHVVFKGGVFELIGIGRKKNGILLRELNQDFFEFVAMYKTAHHIPVL